MCGIVGILAAEPAAFQVVEALKRLEYRGYDSAGVAVQENGVLSRCRAEGKLRNLDAKLREAPLGGLAAIGHTRWATHGKPTEANAHPHMTKRVAVVHRIFALCGQSLKRPAPNSRAKLTQKWCFISCPMRWSG
jgi:glucosamine--fructose-6-phosphate aminotransferase (isomerizing)